MSISDVVGRIEDDRGMRSYSLSANESEQQDGRCKNESLCWSSGSGIKVLAEADMREA